KIERALCEGAPAKPMLSFGVSDARRSWAQWHDRVRIPGPTRRRTPGKKEKVSVCIVHKDRPEFLRECLDGFGRQTRKPDEILIVDNGSTSPLDARKLPRGAKLIRLADTVSVSEARNLLARKATGRWILFFDDDDIPGPRMIDTLVRAADRSQAQIVTCGYERFHPWTKLGSGMVWIPVGDAIE